MGDLAVIPGQMRRLSWSRRTIVAFTAMSVGLVLISVVGIYVYLDLRSGSDSGEFDVSIPQENLGDYLERTAPDPVDNALTETGFAALAGIYPGDRMNPRFWDTPQFTSSAPFGGPGIPDGFEPVDSAQALPDLDPTAVAHEMRIPAINLSSSVRPLEILDLGDSSAYQTPDNTVGFIPETSAPAGVHSGWYFGHLEGFVSGEGSVFRRLPEIAQLVREDPVDILLTTGEAEYMYRVTSTAQIPEEDLVLFDNDLNDIVLVTCWPTRIYDQRVVVTAELIAIRMNSGAAG